MANTQSLLRTNQYRINDTISIYVPTVGEIYDYGESEYYDIVQLLTSVPYDLMVQFDDMGVDYETISEYQLFLMMLESFMLKKKDLSIVFGSLNINSLRFKESENGEKKLVNSKGETVIDKLIQYEISAAIRKIHFWTKTDKRAGNKEANGGLFGS